MGAALGGCGDPLSPAGSISPLCCSSQEKLHCFGTGKGRDWQTGSGPLALPSNPRLWHNLVLVHAHGCALCSGTPCWKCSGQCLIPTHTWALWHQPLLQAEPLQVPGQDRTVPAAPGPALGLPTSNHGSEALGCSWLSPACCSHHSFCTVGPQQPQLCPCEGQQSSVAQVLLACVNRHILA